MTMVNKWTVAAIVTVAVWVWFAIESTRSRGDYDFGPAIVGSMLTVGTIALWLGLVVGAAL